MLDFKKYFEEEYRYTLYNVDFKIIENEPGKELTAQILDNIETEIKENILYIKFVREVSFVPEAVFSLEVAFLVMLTIKDGMHDKVAEIDWKKELTEQPDNPYFSNVIARTAGLIANISSSYGQMPLMTPPILIK